MVQGYVLRAGMIFVGVLIILVIVACACGDESEKLCFCAQAGLVSTASTIRSIVF